MTHDPILDGLAGDPDSFKRSSEARRDALALALRDAYVLARQPDAPQALVRTVRACMDAVGARDVFVVGELEVCWHPTRRFSAARFLRAGELPVEARASCARPLPKLPDRALVFVDPRTFSYRTFEHVLMLDGRVPNDTRLELEGLTRDDVLDLHTFSMHGDTHVLASLSELDAYVAPLNTAMRGGGRFIFHSATLAGALTGAMRRQGLTERIEGFVSVNPVFRCSRFGPEDEPFAAHMDAPYRDPALHHLSTHTVLLYLTGGVGARGPALELEGASLESIEPMMCVVFHQRHEHTGRPFLERDKIFLRTEIIVSVDEETLERSPVVAREFARACYLTGASTWTDELCEDEQEAYDRAARARWGGSDAVSEGQAEAWAAKRVFGTTFLANGYDYWFAGDEVSLEEAAAVAILDHFDCKVAGKPFHTLCDAEVVRGRRDSEWAVSWLARHARGVEEPVTGALKLEWLLPAHEDIDEDERCPDYVTEFQNWVDIGDMTRCAEVVEIYARAQAEARDVLEWAPIWLMGQQVFLNPGRMVIEGDRIHVRAEEPVRRVHFAAMYTWDTDPDFFVEYPDEVFAPHLLLPPIVFGRVRHRGASLWHLQLDFFRNDWMVRVEERKARIPEITREP